MSAKQKGYDLLGGYFSPKNRDRLRGLGGGLRAFSEGYRAVHKPSLLDPSSAKLYRKRGRERISDIKGELSLKYARKRATAIGSGLSVGGSVADQLVNLRNVKMSEMARTGEAYEDKAKSIEDAAARRKRERSDAEDDGIINGLFNVGLKVLTGGLF